MIIPGLDAQSTNQLTETLTSLVIESAKMNLSSNDFR